MSKENKRLGKGIEALFSANNDLNLDDIVESVGQTSGYQIKNLTLEKIRPNPFQPRKTFAIQQLEELAQSIKEHGILQPIVVRKSEFGYDILAGERRYRAAQMINLSHIPAVIKDFDDVAMMELALLENIQREDLNIIEQAQGYQMLLDKCQWTQQTLATRMGKSRSHITNILRLLDLPMKVQEYLLTNQITMGHAKILTGLSESEVYAILDRIIEEDLSVRATEQLVQGYKQQPIKTTKATTNKNDDNVEYRFVEEQLIQYLGTKVDLGSKKMVIHYETINELNDILEKIGYVK